MTICLFFKRKNCGINDPFISFFLAKLLWGLPALIPNFAYRHHHQDLVTTLLYLSTFKGRVFPGHTYRLDPWASLCGELRWNFSCFMSIPFLHPPSRFDRRVYYSIRKSIIFPLVMRELTPGLMLKFSSIWCVMANEYRPSGFEDGYWIFYRSLNTLVSSDKENWEHLLC